MSAGRDDARRAAEAWLTENSLCGHDTALLKFCPTCAEALASVIESVAASRGRGSSVVGDMGEPLTEYDRLRRECGTLIDRLHVGLGVHAEMQADEPDRPAWLADLRKFRLAVLRLGFDTFGDPEFEELLAREGHTT